MPTTGLSNLGRDLEQLFREGSLAGATDARLLERFVSDRDETAFAALMARHREMLLRTFRDLLGDAADIEEAFQATAVILARRARSIRDADALGGWLHRVACRVARRARTEAARRRASEGRAAALRSREEAIGPEPDPVERDEVRTALHDELDRLPDRYRRPLILCLLEGMTHEQAAKRLGWTEGSVRGRLARGKARLRDRLVRRGITVAVVLAELAEPGPIAAARPIASAWLVKAAGVLVSLMAAIGGSSLAIAVRNEPAPAPRAKAAVIPPAPAPAPAPKPEPDHGVNQLASFRGGGPTDQSRASALPAEVAARPVVFLGRVIDPSGKGVEGARISLVTDAWTLPEPQAVSGPDGSFRFARTVGDFWRNFASGGVATPHVQSVVLATHERFGLAWYNLRIVGEDRKPAIGGDDPLILQMTADLPIEGRLIDGRGAPIVGAKVRVGRLYGVPRGDLSPILDALRKRDLAPFQRTFPRVGPNHFEATYVLPVATTGADGRFMLRGVGRERQAELIAEGPGMASIQWTVLNRKEAVEATRVVRERGAASPNGVRVYGPAFDLTVKATQTVGGVVRGANGRPVAGAIVYVPRFDGSGRTDVQGRYRFVLQSGANRFPIVVRPPDQAPLVGAAREVQGSATPGEIRADFALQRAVVVSGRVVERGTGRPMVASQDYGCHGPQHVRAGYLWYRPLASNPTLRDVEIQTYFRQDYENPVLVGVIGADGSFRGSIPPGLGVLLVEDNPGMPFMWDSLGGPWKEGDGLQLRFPYAPLARREPNDGAPGAPGETLPGAFGPIALSGPNMNTRYVAYRVIDPGAGDASFQADITIPAATSRKVRFVDPQGQPVRGATVNGVNAWPDHPVVLDDDEVEILGLVPGQERRITALSADRRLQAEAIVRGDQSGPLTVRMRPPG